MADKSKFDKALKNVLLVPLDKSLTVYLEGDIKYHLGPCEEEGQRTVHITRKRGRPPEYIGIARLVGSGESSSWMLTPSILCLVVGRAMILDFVDEGQSITSNIVGVVLSEPIQMKDSSPMTLEEEDLDPWRAEFI